MDSCAGLVSGGEDADSGLPPPNPRPEKKDRWAGGEDLLGEEPALSLAEPLVPPPTPPSSWARHAPCGRFGIEDFWKTIAVFGETGGTFR